MEWYWIVLIVVGALAVAFFTASWFFFKLSMVRYKKEPAPEAFYQGESAAWKTFREGMIRAQKWLEEKTAEHPEITSFDGLKLSAMYVPADTDKPRGTLIVFHGYRSLATVDFAPEVEFLHSLGYRLLIPYQRSHGDSEGKYITYGLKERFDCRDWARYIDKRFPGEDIFLMGISMGCATVVMSAGTELPGTVRGVVADCGFTSPWEIMAFVAKRDYHIPAFPLLNGVDLFSRCLAGCALKSVDTRKVLAETKLPFLFIHGEKDDFVPLYMTKENYAAYGTVSGSADKELFLVPEAAHALSFVTDPEGCGKATAAFFEKYRS